jgi:hypothetical protein
MKETIAEKVNVIAYIKDQSFIPHCNRFLIDFIKGDDRFL